MKYLAALPASFHSSALYRDVATRWKGAGLLYQLFLIGIATLVVAIRLHAGAGDFVRRESPPIVAQLPTIDIDHGVVSVNHPMPMTITDPDSGKVLAIIDTSGETTSLEGTGASLLLTRDRLIVQRRSGETRIYDLQRIEHLHLERKGVTRGLRVIGAWFAVLCAPFILAGFYAVRLLVLLVAATILYLLGRSAAVDFATAMRLASVALTPATLLEAALDAFGTKPGLWGVLWLVLAAAYLAFAWRSGRPPRPIAAEPESPAPEPIPPAAPY